jgi:hypothetical protein
MPYQTYLSHVKTQRRAHATLRDAFRGAYRHHWRGDGRFAEFPLAFRAGVCSRRNAPSSARSLVTFFDSENGGFSHASLRRRRPPPRATPPFAVDASSVISRPALLPRALPTRKTPSPAFSTTSSSRTFSELSILTTPQISHGSQRDAMAETGLRFEKLDEYEAADRGCVSAVERMQRGGRLSHQQYLCQAAARSGNLEKLKEFRANRCPWNVLTCAGAAYGGHLEVLQWARANGAPWDWQTCMRAAAGGHLEVLQWARVNGCPWEKYTSHWAADEGHLDTLKFARANGCRWTASTRDRAADLGYIESDGSLSDE